MEFLPNKEVITFGDKYNGDNYEKVIMNQEDFVAATKMRFPQLREYMAHIAHKAPHEGIKLLGMTDDHYNAFILMCYKIVPNYKKEVQL